MIFRLFYLTASLILVLDIVTKQIVYRSMTLGQSIPVLGDFLKWTYIHNDGAAFGLFQGNRWFFVGVSVLSILVLVTLAHSARYRRPFLLFSLGLILGGAVAHTLGRGFIPIRKKGKLPHRVIGQEYQLEYGVDTIEIHADAIQKGDRILLSSPHDGVFRTEVSEIRVDDQAVETVGKGEVFTLRLEEKVRPTTKLYKIVDA